jgi:N-acetylneuraminic acid mutarotase
MVSYFAGPDGTIYAMCGAAGPDIYNTVEASDPSATPGRLERPCSRPAGGAAATGADGHIYAIGGSTGPPLGTILDTVEAYNPLTNTWTTVSLLPSARAQLAATTGQDGRIYVTGGYNLAGPLNVVEAYEP